MARDEVFSKTTARGSDLQFNEEILKKREALENVLIPYRFDENFELFRRNGFTTVETFFQWYNFAGFLCVKNV